MPGVTRDLISKAALPTPVLADAALRLAVDVRQAPAGIHGPPNASVAGRALPVRHHGSVDVFLEALEQGTPGDVMVIDNDGRRDEACIGDLVAHEAMAAGLAGIVIWGLHRDVVEIGELEFPVFSYGTVPFGPGGPRPIPDERFTVAKFADTPVTRSDIVFADPNGVVFVAEDQLEALLPVAVGIRDAETEQNELLASGRSLREQFDFAGYLQDRDRDPDRTFRQHLRERGRSIEE